MEMERDDLYRTYAALFELLSLGFKCPEKELADALAHGDYEETCRDLLLALGVVDSYDGAFCENRNWAEGRSSEEVLHGLRVEYTHLFTGLPDPVASPYAGVWWAHRQGVEPLLFVNERSMGVERFMRSCGIGRPEGKNEPLDHIATMLEFMQYISLVNSGDVPSCDVVIDEETLNWFVEAYLSDWLLAFCNAVKKGSRLPFYVIQATMLEEVLCGPEAF